MGNFISVPDWANALFNVLEPASKKKSLTSKVENGKVLPSATLRGDLGIKRKALPSLATGINRVIEQHRHPYSKTGAIAMSDLDAMPSLGHLTSYVADLVSVPAWADALYKVLDTATNGQPPITPRVESGEITSNTSLMNNLNIGTQALGALVDQVNGVIETFRIPPAGTGFVQRTDLQQWDNFGVLNYQIALAIGVAP